MTDFQVRSASEVTTIWRYTNLFIIIIIIRETRYRWHSIGITAEQAALVWACAVKRRRWLGEEIHGMKVEGPRPKRTWREVVKEDCLARKLNKEDRMLRSVEECPTIRMGVSGWVFLLVPSYPGSPGPKAVKRLCVRVIQWSRPRAFAGVGAMNVGEFAERKPADTRRICVAVDCHRSTTWRHFKRLSDVLIQLKVRYATPVLRRYAYKQLCTALNLHCMFWFWLRSARNEVAYLLLYFSYSLLVGRQEGRAIRRHSCSHAAHVKFLHFPDIFQTSQTRCKLSVLHPNQLSFS